MSRARNLSRLANEQAISVDSSLNVGINSLSPDAKLDVVGVVSATEFYGDGSNLTGVSSPGLGTALSDDTTSPLNSIYFTNANLSVASTITVNPPSSASAAFTQYANIVLQNDADLIVADGDTFIPDILGIGTDVDEPGTLTGGAGKLRVDNITDKAGTGAPNFPNGVVIAGVTTATSFVGALTGNVTGEVQVATGATISGSTNTITALTNGSERLRITSGGKVLINSTDDSNYATMVVRGLTDNNHPIIKVRGTNANGYTFLGDDYSGGDESQFTMGLAYSGASIVTGWGVRVSTSANDTYLSSQDTYSTKHSAIKHDGNGWRFLSNSTSQTVTTGSAVTLTERLRITSAGKIGIGTNNPSELLHLQSGQTKQILKSTNLNTASSLIFDTQNINTADFLLGQLAGRWNGNDVAYINFEAGSDTTNDDDGVITFLTSASGSTPLERLRIDNAGHVGIATDMTGHNVMLGVFGDGTASNKPATIYQNPSTGTGQAQGFYVGINHNDKTGYVWNYEADALSFATNNVQRARIDSDGYMTVAPSGMVIRSGFYDPGTGTNAITATNSSTFTTLNVNGTGQVGHNIGKFSDDGLTYNKVSSNSHLNISISFPFYLATGGTGFGIRALLSTDDGSNYYVVSGLSDGPADKWSAGGYGGNTSGIVNYTWNTRMNSSRASTILAKTGTIRFYFEVACWSSADNLTIGDYSGYARKGSIVVQEIAE